jgi:hypothetical protein
MTCISYIACQRQRPTTNAPAKEAKTDRLNTQPTKESTTADLQSTDCLDSELQTIRGQYKRPPDCSEFTNADKFKKSSAATSHFKFDELRDPKYKWAILKTSLLVGSTCLYESPDGSLLTVNNAYRSPSGNAVVDKKMQETHTESRHIYGDAVDFVTNDLVEFVFNRYKAQAVKCGACVEPWDWVKKHPHVHADWRLQDGQKCFSSWPQPKAVNVAVP